MFDAIAQLCVPVFLYHADSYPVLPFTAYVDYGRFALSFAVRGAGDVKVALQRLWAFPLSQGKRLQQQVLEAAPALSATTKLSRSNPLGIVRTRSRQIRV